MQIFFMVYFLLAGGISLMASYGNLPIESSQTASSLKEKKLSFEEIKVKNIELFYEVKDLSSIGAIFDLDGTLTQDDTPSKLKKVTANGDIKGVINFLKKKNVPFVISSAWDVFSETLERLNTLGLVDYTKPKYTEFSGFSDEQIKPLEFFDKETTQDLSDSDDMLCDEDLDGFTTPKIPDIDGQYFDYSKASITQGRANLKDIHGKPQEVSYINYTNNDVNIASVSLVNLSWLDRYYRQKALAPLWTNARKAFEKVKEIWFFDDNEGNIEYFKNDIEMFRNHYPALEIVKIFYVQIK